MASTASPNSSAMPTCLWGTVDLLAFPTAGTTYRVAELLAAPVALNSNLGRYTNFVNLLDMAAVAVPAGARANGTGFGITLIGPADSDRGLLDAAETYLAAADLPAPPPLDLEGQNGNRETRRRRRPPEGHAAPLAAHLARRASSSAPSRPHPPIASMP